VLLVRLGFGGVKGSNQPESPSEGVGEGSPPISGIQPAKERSPMSYGQTYAAVWDYMPQTLRARELNEAYIGLEKLYWRIARLSVLALVSKSYRLKLGRAKADLAEKKSDIRSLGGLVPPLWSI